MTTHVKINDRLKLKIKHKLNLKNMIPDRLKLKSESLKLNDTKLIQ